MANGCKRVLGFLGVISALMVLVCACSAPGTPQPKSAIQAVPVFPDCGNTEFALPESVVAAGERVDSLEYWDRFYERRRNQDRWLSVHLDLVNDVIGYGDPVPFRLTITNGTDRPVIFVRPQRMTLFLEVTYQGIPIQLLIFLASSGERIAPVGHALVQVQFPPPTRESFSVLPAGESCALDLPFLWNETLWPLEEPIPPGDYQMSMALRGTALGLGPEDGGYVDIGAWVGCSDVSNVVSFTVRQAHP